MTMFIFPLHDEEGERKSDYQNKKIDQSFQEFTKYVVKHNAVLCPMR